MVKGRGFRILWGLLLLAATPAWAGTNYYIRSDGSNSNDGLTNSSGGAWETLSKANSYTSFLPGDTINIVSTDTTATDFATDYEIAPLFNGSPDAAIVYRGTAGAPESTAVSEVNLGYFTNDNPHRPFGSYIVVQNVRLKNGFIGGRVYPIGAPQGSRIEFCYINGPLYLLGMQDCKFYGNRVRGSVHMVCNGWEEIPQGNSVANVADTLMQNTFDPDTLTGSGFPYMRCNTSYCVFDSNTVETEFSYLDAGNAYGRALYQSHFNRFVGNTLTFGANTVQTTPDHTQYLFYLRDSSNTNHFEGEVWTQTGSYGRDAYISASGSYPGTTRDNMWKDNRIYTTGSVSAQNGFRVDSLIGNVIVSTAVPFHTGRTDDDFVMQHNTIVALRSEPAVQFEDYGSESWLPGTDIRWNIFARAWSDNCDGDSNDQPIYEIPSGALGSLVQNENLFYSYAGATEELREDYAVKVGDSCSPADSAGVWRDTYAMDLLSAFGDPLLADTAFATFDATPSNSSPAFSGWSTASGGYVGAIAPGDTIAPDSCQIVSVTYDAGVVTVLMIVGGDDAGSGTALDVTLGTNGSAFGTGNCEDYFSDGATQFSEAEVTVENASPPAGGALLQMRCGVLTAVDIDCEVVVRIRDEAGNVAYSRACVYDL